MSLDTPSLLRHTMPVNTQFKLFLESKMKKDTTWLSTVEAAVYLGRSPRTLEKWRAMQTGPDYKMSGNKVRYSNVELDKWVRGKA